MKPKAPATFFIPGAPLGNRSVKKGDNLSLEVVFVDPDNGDLEVKMVSTEGPEDELRPMLEEAFSPEKGTMNYG